MCLLQRVHEQEVYPQLHAQGDKEKERLFQKISTLLRNRVGVTQMGHALHFRREVLNNNKIGQYGNDKDTLRFLGSVVHCEELLRGTDN